MPTKEELLQYARDMAEAFGYDADSAVSRAEQGIADGTLKTYSDVRRALMAISPIPTDSGQGALEDIPTTSKPYQELEPIPNDASSIGVSPEELDSDISSADQLGTPTEPPSTPSKPTPTGKTGDLRSYARKAAEKVGIDPDIFVRQMEQESGFNPNARSPKGAVGVAQIMPATARGWKVDPTDPYASLDAAAKAMKGYLDSNNGAWDIALAMYNAGPGAVAKYGGVPPFAETRNYISKILRGTGIQDYKPGYTSQTEGPGFKGPGEPDVPRIDDDPRFTQNPPYGGGRQLGDIMGDLGQFKDQLSGLSPFAAERFLPFGPNKDEMDRTANNLLRFMGMNADIGNPVVDQLRQFITQTGAPTARILDVLGGSEDVLAPGSEELGLALGRRAGTVMDFIGKGGSIPNPHGTIAQILDAQRRASANDETLPVGLRGLASGLGDAESVIREILPMFYGRVAPDLMPYWKQGIRKREEQFRNTAPDQTFLDFVFGR